MTGFANLAAMHRGDRRAARSAAGPPLQAATGSITTSPGTTTARQADARRGGPDRARDRAGRPRRHPGREQRRLADRRHRHPLGRRRRRAAPRAADARRRCAYQLAPQRRPRRDRQQPGAGRQGAGRARRAARPRVRSSRSTRSRPRPVPRPAHLGRPASSAAVATCRGSPTRSARRERSLTRDDLATIIYTSGTTGNPKGVMLTHGNLLSNAEATAGCAGSSPADVLLSWLPYSHIYARTCDHLPDDPGRRDALPGRVGRDAGGEPGRDPADLDDVGPAVLREGLGERRGTCRSPSARRRLRRIFGPRVRRLSSGGAPLPRHVAEGFVEAGLALARRVRPDRELAGHQLQPPRRSTRSGRSGRPIPGVEVKIADDGEILTRGPHVMKGYWNDPEATRAGDRLDGWLHTGDVGHLDADGFLTITDRKKDLIITSRRQEHRPGRARSAARRATRTSTRPSSTATAGRSSRP